MRGFGGRVIREGFCGDRVHVGRREGGPVSGQEEFCEQLILHLANSIERLAKLMCTPAISWLYQIENLKVKFRTISTTSHFA